jgi:hypothetical protein
MAYLLHPKENSRIIFLFYAPYFQVSRHMPALTRANAFESQYRENAPRRYAAPKSNALTLLV